MAKYACPDAEVFSIEQFPKVAYMAKQNLARVALDVNVLHKEPEIFTLPEAPGQSFSGFKDLPKGPWDMVVIDGPGPFKWNGLVTESPNGDIFRILNDMTEGATVYVDGRKDAVKLMMRYLGQYLTPTHMGQNSATFVRTAKQYNPADVTDGLLEALNRENYF